MRTTKPVSTISFNSPAYLRVKLTELERAGLLSFWAFIVHKPEDDEAGLKAHMHVYMEPSKMIQTDNIRNELRELDPLHPDKPLACLTFKSSKFGPWYLYALHDKRYLASKGQTRRFHYGHDEIVSSDPDDLLAKSREIDMLSISPFADMLDAQEHGVSWAEYFARGTVPLAMVQQFQTAWFLLVEDRTYRNSREGHG